MGNLVCLELRRIKNVNINLGICKMAADVQLVLCAPLCFLVSRIHSLETELLHCGLFGHYTGESITAAKKRLKDDIDNMKLTIKVLRLPDRRDSDNRKENEVNDLIKLMKFLDNEKLLDKLPKYVADNPDAMPCFRIVDGDFRHLIHRMNAMEAMLSSVYAILNRLPVSSNMSYSNSVSYTAAPQTTRIQSGPSVDQHRVGFSQAGFPRLVENTTTAVGNNQSQLFRQAVQRAAGQQPRAEAREQEKPSHSNQSLSSSNRFAVLQNVGGSRWGDDCNIPSAGEITEVETDGSGEFVYDHRQKKKIKRHRVQSNQDNTYVSDEPSALNVWSKMNHGSNCCSSDASRPNSIGPMTSP